MSFAEPKWHEECESQFLYILRTHPTPIVAFSEDRVLLDKMFLNLFVLNIYISGKHSKLGLSFLI